MAAPPHAAPDAPAAPAETRRAYRADWQAFQAWCDAAGHAALPAAPATLCDFLTASPTLSAGTAGRSEHAASHGRRQKRRRKRRDRLEYRHRACDQSLRADPHLPPVRP
jgi:hypothetical protein